MIALDFVQNLKALPACLHVEPQSTGGWLIECPGCSSYRLGGPILALNQIGEDLVVRCYGGCDEAVLVESLGIAGGTAPLIGAHQWLERESSRGYERAYLQGMLSRLLPLPSEFRPPEHPKARTWDEFMALEPIPRESLCGQWFLTESLVMVSGDSGAGKTWFCLDLALSVSTGTPFMGRWSVPRAHKVLLVSGEDSIQDLKARMPALLKGKEKAADQKLVPQVTFLAARDRALLPRGLPNLGTPEGRAKVEASLEGVSLVILDNYSVLFNGVDENDAKEFAPIQDWLFELSARGIAVLLVAHTGKNGDHRGSSKKIDGLNVSIILNHPTNWKASDGASFNLQFKKSRDAQGPEVDPFSAKLGKDEEGEICWLFDETPATTTKPDSKTSEILGLHSQGKTAKEIIEAGYSKPTVYRVLKYATKTHSPGASGVSVSVSVSPPLKGGETMRLETRPPKSPESQSQSHETMRLETMRLETKPPESHEIETIRRGPGPTQRREFYETKTPGRDSNPAKKPESHSLSLMRLETKNSDETETAERDLKLSRGPVFVPSSGSRSLQSNDWIPGPAK